MHQPTLPIDAALGAEDLHALVGHLLRGAEVEVAIAGEFSEAAAQYFGAADVCLVANLVRVGIEENRGARFKNLSVNNVFVQLDRSECHD